MRISDWSSDVCSSDLIDGGREILGRRAILALDDAAAVAAACLIDERIAVFGPLLDRRIIVVAGELPDIGDRAVAVVQDGRRAVRPPLTDFGIAVVRALEDVRAVRIAGLFDIDRRIDRTDAAGRGDRKSVV